MEKPLVLLVHLRSCSGPDAYVVACLYTCCIAAGGARRHSHILALTTHSLSFYPHIL